MSVILADIWTTKLLFSFVLYLKGKKKSPIRLLKKRAEKVKTA